MFCLLPKYRLFLRKKLRKDKYIPVEEKSRENKFIIYSKLNIEGFVIKNIFRYLRLIVV